jgi:hypothetical protein
MLMSLIAPTAIMQLSLPGKVSGMIRRPAETYRILGDEPLSRSILYLVVLLVINTVLIGLLGVVAVIGYLIFEGGSVDDAVGAIFGSILNMVISPIMSIISIGLIIVILHLAAVVLRGRGSPADTVQVVIYGATPAFLIGWIPLLGVIAYLWSFVLFAIGLRERHQMEMTRAGVASLVTLILMVILMVIFDFVLSLFMLGMAWVYQLGG